MNNRLKCFRCGCSVWHTEAFHLPDTHNHRNRAFCDDCFEDMGMINPRIDYTVGFLMVCFLAMLACAIIALTTSQ